jgi:hypothetical protein
MGSGSAIVLTDRLTVLNRIKVSRGFESSYSAQTEAQILYLRFNSVPRKDQQRLRPDNTRYEALSAQAAAHRITPTGWLIFPVLSLWLRSRCHRVLNPAQQVPSMCNRQHVKPFWTQMKRHGQRDNRRDRRRDSEAQGGKGPIGWEAEQQTSHVPEPWVGQ